MAENKGPFDRLFSRIGSHLGEADQNGVDEEALRELKKAESDAAKRRAEVRKELADGARPKRGRFRL